MTKSIRILTLMLVTIAALLNACGATSVVSSPAAPKVEAAQVAFTGVIESIDGTQWVIDGQKITVDPAVAAEAAFEVGDTVKVEAVVAADGSVSALRVEVPGAENVSIPTRAASPSATANVNLPGGITTPTPGGPAGNDNSNSNFNTNDDDSDDDHDDDDDDDDDDHEDDDD